MKKQILTCIFLGACASGFAAEAFGKLYPDHDGFSMGGGRSAACSATISAHGSGKYDDGDSATRPADAATQVRISTHEIHAIRSRDTDPLTQPQKSALEGLILGLGMEVGYSQSELYAGISHKFYGNTTAFANAKSINLLDPESLGRVRLFENALNMYLRIPIVFYAESAAGEYSSKAAGKKRRAAKTAKYVAITQKQHEDIQLRNLILQELKP